MRQISLIHNKGGDIINRVAGDGILFEQRDFGRMTVSELSSLRFGLTCAMYGHPDYPKTQINMHDKIAVEAEEHHLAAFDDEPLIVLKFASRSGAPLHLTVHGVSATELIEALEAARMANTPEALMESAQ